MIDIENAIYDKVKKAINAQYPTAVVESVPIQTVTSLPVISFYQSDNSVDSLTVDTTSFENFANVSFECNIFCDGTSKKQTAKKIAEIVDSVMENVHLRRIFYSPTPNLDITIYRLVLRYTGTVSRSSISGDTAKHTIYS